MTKTAPIKEGLIGLGPKPHLIGSQCLSCEQHHFPKATTCPYCRYPECSETQLPTTGVIWSFTAVTAAPPGYTGPIPYGVGIVELPVGLRVITRLSESDPSKMEVGDQVHLVLEELPIEYSGGTGLVWSFAPGAT